MSLLKFFEKNEIETGSQSIITIGSDNQDTLKERGGSFLESDSQSRQFRSITKELVRYQKFIDGESFIEPFKINEVNRGQAETTSRSTGSAVTKSLTATFEGTGTIQRSPVLQNLSYNFSVPRLRLEPILDASITDSDGETTTRLANGFVDPNYSVIKNIASLDSIIVGGSSVNVFGSEGQVNESKVEDIDETFTTPKTATVRYTDSAGDIVHEEVSMDLPYRLRGETWEVFDKVGVALREQSASRFISQIMRQTIELRGVDLEMQLDPNNTILPNMTDFDPRPFTIALNSVALIFERREILRAGASTTTDQTEAFLSSLGTGNHVTLHYTVQINYTISGSGKASSSFSFSGSQPYSAVIEQRDSSGDDAKSFFIQSVSGLGFGFVNDRNLREEFSNSVSLASIRASMETAARNYISLNPVLSEFLTSFNAPEEINRLVVNLQDNAIRQRTPFDAPDSQIYNVNTTATTTTGQNIGTHDLRDLALPEFKARPFEVTGGDNKTLGTSQVLLNRKSVALLTNQTYSPSSIETFVGSESEEARKQKLGFQDLVTFDPDEIPLVDRQGRALSREIINENFLPITATKTISGSEVTFSLIAIVKETGTDNLVQLWQRSDGANVTASNLSGLTYRMLRADGSIRTEEVISSSRGNHVFNGVTYQSFSSNLTNLLTFVYPNFTDFGDTLNIVDAREKLYSDAVNVAIDFSGATAGEEEQTIGFQFDSIDAFPDVTIDLAYLENTNQLRLILNRNNEFAPIPDKAFFDSMTINNRTFNFSGSSYSSDEDTGNATYLFSSSTPPISDTAETFDITFTKSGESFTRAFDIERVVRKSTIRQTQSKELPEFLGSYKVKDISFSESEFVIEFDETEMSADSFSSLQVLGVDDGEITRQLKSADAVITNENTFTWSNLSEFRELKKNKTYRIEILRGASGTEDVFFVPQPSGDFHFLQNVIYEGSTFSFDLKNFSTKGFTSTPINSFALLRNNVSVISTKLIIDLIATADNSQGITKISAENETLSLSVGSYQLRLEVEDLPSIEVNITQMTDLVFDTIVILNTNLTNLFVKDTMDRYLINPSDVREIKEVTEADGSRHIVLFLKNTIVSPVIKLENTAVAGQRSNRQIGQIFLLKSLGEFSKTPMITTHINSSKTPFKTQLNKSHVKTLPESLSYTLNFSNTPLDTNKDISLAQDLFARLSDYNEFVMWVNGGNDMSDKKFTGLKGFRFQDIIKGLTLNNYSFSYADNLLSSGVAFTIEIAEVP